MSASKEFNKIRARFMKLASAPKLPANVLKLAYLIAYTHMDSASETAWVGQKRLAADLDVTTRAVQKLTVTLRRFGLEVETGKGPEQANVYRIGDPPEAENANCSSPISVENTNCSSPIEAENTNWSDIKTRTGETENANYSSPLLNKNLQEESPRKGRKTLSPPVALPVSKKARKGPAAEARIKAEAEPNRDAETAQAFPRFWAVYPCHQNEKLARKAFARAEINTDPEIIITGAQRYALAEQLRLSRPKQTGQHTAHAHNWLDAERWNDPPPPGLVVDEAGHPLAIEQQDGQEDNRDPLERVMAEASSFWPDWKDGQ
jgi:hypothetical protein